MRNWLNNLIWEMMVDNKLAVNDQWVELGRSSTFWDWWLDLLIKLERATRGSGFKQEVELTPASLIEDCLVWAKELQQYHEKKAALDKRYYDEIGEVPPLPTELAHANSLMEDLETLQRLVL